MPNMARPMQKISGAAVTLPQYIGCNLASRSACAECLRQLRRRKQLVAGVQSAHPHQQLHSIPNRPKAARSSRRASRRCLATVQEDKGLYTPGRNSRGPLAEYDARVSRGTLTNDEHQRSGQQKFIERQRTADHSSRSYSELAGSAQYARGLPSAEGEQALG